MNVTLYNQDVNLPNSVIREGQSKGFFAQESYNAYIQIKEQYRKYEGLGKVIQYMPGYVDMIYMQIAKKATDKLQEDGIYTVSANRFLDGMFESGKHFDEAITELSTNLFEIVNEKRAAEEYRNYRKESRGKIVGGGFGVTGAIEGMAIAGSINLVTGVAHSLFNVFDGMITDNEFSSRIDELYNNHDSSEKLAIAVRQDIINMWPIFFEAYGFNYLADELLTRKLFRDAKSILENIQDGSIPPERRKDALIRAIVNLPYQPIVYTTAYKYLGNPDNTLSDYASIFGITVDFSEEDNTDTAAKEYLGNLFSKIEERLRGDEYYDELKKHLTKNTTLEDIADVLYAIYKKKYGEKYLYGPSTYMSMDHRDFRWADIPDEDQCIFYFSNCSFSHGTSSEFVFTNDTFIYKDNDDNVDSIPIIQMKSINEKTDTNKYFLIDESIKIYADELDNDKFHEIYHLLCIYSLICIALLKSNTYVNVVRHITNAQQESTPKSDSIKSINLIIKNGSEDEIKAKFKDIRTHYDSYDFYKYIYYLGDDDKSDQKITKAISSYAYLHEEEIPCICFDSTVMGGAEDGILVTNQGIYIHNPYEKVIYLTYQEIDSIEVQGVFSKDLYINNLKIYKPGGMDNTDIESFGRLIKKIAGI